MLLATAEDRLTDGYILLISRWISSSLGALFFGPKVPKAIAATPTPIPKNTQIGQK